MTKASIYAFFILSFLMIGKSSIGQKQGKFSNDPKKYQNEVKDFFKNYKSEKVTQTLDAYLEQIELGKFSTEEFDQIVKTSNFMLAKRYKAVPDFQMYYSAIVAYKNKGIELTKFNQWHKVLKKILKKTTKDRNYAKYNKTILNLFNERAIYKDRAKSWYITTSNYSIGFEKVPVIKVNSSTDLICLTKADTLKITKTTGVFYPVQNKWVGSKGKVTWARVQLDSNKVYAKLNTYNINVKKSEVIADSVLFYQRTFFTAPLMGQLHDKAMASYRGAKAPYPVFRSYKSVYILHKISKNVVFIGGFSMQGAKILGSSSDNKKAKMIIIYKGAPTLKAESDIFNITADKIVSDDAEITLYYEGDSMYHPKLIFNYNKAKRQLTLTRGKQGLYRSPMINTYHQLEMEFDQIIWKIDDALMDFQLFQGSEGSALFTSTNFFMLSRYLSVQGILSYHPLQTLKKYSENIESREFNLADYANYMGMKAQNMQSMLIRLALDGYVYYNIQTGDIKVRNKTIMSVNSSKGKSDYDMINFESKIARDATDIIRGERKREKIGTFSFNSGNLNIREVRKVLISDTQHVMIFPKNREIIIKKNRNFQFDGKITAGRFQFYGNRFYFDYDQFKFNMSSIDSMVLYVPLRNPKTHYYELKKVQSVLQNINGYLYVDNPRNKSGRVSYPVYPIFECNKFSWVYYDDPRILDSVYTRERFSFKIKPFKIDSLDNFMIEGAKFNGTFYSDGIIPTFNYDLIPQKHDLSLGFTKTDNFKLYKGKGEGDITINLSNQGLRAKGEIKYLTSVTKTGGEGFDYKKPKYSEDFILYPDSIRSNSKSFNLAHNAMGKYPQVKGVDVFTRWLPYQNTMHIEKRKKPFYIFKNEIEFYGDLLLTPEKLTSKGVFNYKNSEIISDAFVFKPTNLQSKNAVLKIKSDDERLAFFAPKIRIDLDVEKNISVGESNEEQHQIQFPLNQYTTSLKHFTWDINNNKIDIAKSTSQTEGYFLSLGHDQDSLKFIAGNAKYDLNNYLLNIKKIPFIPIADARIFPDAGKVVIEKVAIMQTLENAVIKVDTINNYHKIYNALVNVFGKYKYTGYGMYDYFDKYKNKQTFKFYQIRIDENTKTFARAKIPKNANFMLSPQFGFTGKAELNGDIKELKFDGYVLPKHQIRKYQTTWFSFENRINPDKMYFYIDKPKNEEGKDLFTGIYHNIADSPYVYSVFFGKLMRYNDLDMFSLNQGVLFYDDTKGSFVFADTNKIFYESLRGNYFALNDKSGNSTCEGIIDFHTDIQSIEIKSAGNVKYNHESGSYKFDLLMSFDFPFNENALKYMSDLIIETSYDRKDTKDDRLLVRKALADLVEDEKERTTILDNLESYNVISLEKSLIKTMFFSEIRFSYKIASRSFITIDRTIGLTSIKNASLNKLIAGGIELAIRRSGGSLDIFLEEGDSYFYYFKYRTGLFGVLSSDPIYNDEVINTLAKYSKLKYKISKASVRQFVQFKKKLNFE